MGTKPVCIKMRSIAVTYRAGDHDASADIVWIQASPGVERVAAMGRWIREWIALVGDGLPGDGEPNGWQKDLDGR